MGMGRRDYKEKITLLRMIMSGSAKNRSSKALLYFLKVSLYIFVEGGRVFARQIRQLGAGNLNMPIFQDFCGLHALGEDDEVSGLNGTLYMY